MNKVKSSIKYVKQDVSSFIEDQPAPNRQTNTNPNSEEHYLSCFPLKTESELLAIESTLQNEELSYTNKLVCCIFFYYHYGIIVFCILFIIYILFYIGINTSFCL